MIKFIHNIFLSFSSLILLTAGLYSATVPTWLVNPALEIVKDPLLLPLDFHFDFIDLLPASPKKRFQIEVPASSLLFGNAALLVKVKALDDDEYQPRVTIAGSYWTNIAMGFIPGMEASMTGYDYGFNIAKTVEENDNGTVELFAGFRNMFDQFELVSSTPIKIMEGTEINRIAKNGSTYLLHFGIVRRYEKNIASAQVGIDLSRSSVFLHFMFGGDRARYGFGVYPDSVIFLKPFFSVHFGF